MAITNNDQQVLQAILGVEQLPDDVVQEAELRTKLYHGAGGASGPLGPLAMIELTRFLGYRPKRAEAKPEAVVWRNLPTDGSVKVTAGPYFGSMQDGVYLGIVSDGLLAIKLNTDGFVRECRAAMVTLAEEVHEDYREERTPVADLLSNTAQEAAPEAAAVAVEEPVEEQIEVMPEFSWDSIPKDSPVWVSRGDDQDTLEGVFIKVQEDGKLSIKIEGEKKPRSFNKETVLYAG